MTENNTYSNKLKKNKTMKQNNHRSVSLRTETLEMLATIKACYQLGEKKNLTYDEIISRLLPLGLEQDSRKVANLLKTLEEENEDSTKQHVQFDDDFLNDYPKIEEDEE